MACDLQVTEREIIMNKALKMRLAAIPALVLATGGSAFAALPTGAAEAIDAYRTDVVAVFGLLIAAGIAIFAVRKLGQKMGWL
jgi:hypothetical protein